MYFGPLAVRASSQGLGLGKQLIAHVAGLGRAKGCSVVEISVVSTVRTACHHSLAADADTLTLTH
jgi:GNAT superfamily N-acetyltransferase